ncbi:MAG: hypothetical protein ACYTGQ_09275, partial [Planctomycetota bacterium]
MFMATLMVGFGVTPPAQGANRNYDVNAGGPVFPPFVTVSPESSYFNPANWNGGVPNINDNVRINGTANFAFIDGSGADPLYDGPAEVRELLHGWTGGNDQSPVFGAGLFLNEASMITSTRNTSFRIGENNNKKGVIYVNNSSIRTQQPRIGHSGAVSTWLSPIQEFIPDPTHQAVFNEIFDNKAALPMNQLHLIGGREFGGLDGQLIYQPGVDGTALPTEVSNGAGNANVILPFGPYIPQGASSMQYFNHMQIGNSGTGGGLVVLGLPVDELPDPGEVFGDVPGNSNFNTPGVSTLALNDKEDYLKLRFHSVLDQRGGQLRVGQNGAGVFIQNSGMVSVRAGNIHIGNGTNNNSRGLYILNNGYIRTNNGQLRIGHNGNGTFIMNGGRVDLDQHLRISHQNNGTNGAHGKNRLIINDGMMQVGTLNQAIANLIADNNRDLVVGWNRGQNNSNGQGATASNNRTESVFDMNGGNLQVSRDIVIARTNNSIGTWNANGGEVFVFRNVVVGANAGANGTLNFDGTKLTLGTRTAFGTSTGSTETSSSFGQPVIEV